MKLGALEVRIRHATLLCAAMVFALLLLAAPAHATFPGKNGKLVFLKSGNLATVNPDGTGETVLPGDGFFRENPRWSPDGRRIAVDRLTGCVGDGCFFDLATLAADGSDEVVVGTTEGSEPAWSPDGTQLAYSQIDFFGPVAEDIRAVRLDG